jgi:hypothetical protein
MRPWRLTVGDTRFYILGLFRDWRWRTTANTSGGFVLERQSNPGTKCRNLTIFDFHIHFHDLGDAQVSDRSRSRFDRVPTGFLPWARWRTSRRAHGTRTNVGATASRFESAGFDAQVMPNKTAQ